MHPRPPLVIRVLIAQQELLVHEDTPWLLMIFRFAFPCFCLIYINTFISLFSNEASLHASRPQARLSRIGQSMPIFLFLGRPAASSMLA